MALKLSEEVTNLLKNETFIKGSKFMYDQHFPKMQRMRGLTQLSKEQIVQAILNGQVIEIFARYNHEEKYIIHCTTGDKVFHIIMFYYEDTILLKTIYVPDTETGHFEKDLKTRINGSQLDYKP